MDGWTDGWMDSPGDKSPPLSPAKRTAESASWVVLLKVQEKIVLKESCNFIL